jgi:hypothetical protein
MDNSKDKASLLACGGKAHFVPSGCTVANRKAVHFKEYCWYCNGELLPKKVPYVKNLWKEYCPNSVSIQRFNLNFINTKFLLLSYESVSQIVLMHASLYLKTVIQAINHKAILHQN